MLRVLSLPCTPLAPGATQAGDSLGTEPWGAGRQAVPGLMGSLFNLSFAGITLYSHPYGGALLNEDKM